MAVVQVAGLLTRLCDRIEGSWSLGKNYRSNVLTQEGTICRSRVAYCCRDMFKRRMMFKRDVFKRTLMSKQVHLVNDISYCKNNLLW